MINFYITIHRHNDILFDSIGEAREAARRAGLRPDDFMILPYKHAKKPPTSYSVFAYGRWQGGCHETIDDAIEYARSRGFIEFAIYRDSMNKLADAVYSINEKGEVEYDARNQ